MFSQEKLDAFVALVRSDYAARMKKDYPDSKLPVDKVYACKPGKKFVRVNIGSSGRYMIDISDGTIYGIKGYGVVHYGHVYGTIDTINDWFWGEYYPCPMDAARLRLRSMSVELPVDIKAEVIEKEEVTVPVVGMGATVCGYTDKYAGTIIRVTEKRMDVQRDKAIINPNWKPLVQLGGFVGHCTNQDEQKYTYERNPEGEIFHCSLRTSDTGKSYWKLCGSKRQMVKVGVREEFYDYNF